MATTALTGPLPSRLDLLATDTKANELLSEIITEYSPKRWYYFLNHILHIKKGDINPHSINTNDYCYKFDKFNKFFDLFKSGFRVQNHHNQLFDNIYYGRIWILHANSHLIDYKTNPLYSNSKNEKKNKLHCISDIYKKLYQNGIGTNNSEFYIQWAKYYIFRKKFHKAKKRLNIGKKKQLINKNEFESFYSQICQKYNENDTTTNYIFDSELISTDTSFNDSEENQIQSENESENENINSPNMEIDNGKYNHNNNRNKYRKQSFIFSKPPQRVLPNDSENDTNNGAESDYFDDDDDESDNEYSESEEKYNINSIGKLQSVTENGILSPNKNKNVRTPFAVIKNIPNNRNNNNNMSIYSKNKNLRPYTPNTLIKNMHAYKKSNHTFENRNSTNNNILKSIRKATPYNHSRSHSVTSTIKHNNKTLSPYTDKPKSATMSKTNTKSPSLPLPIDNQNNNNNNKQWYKSKQIHSTSSPLMQQPPPPQPIHNRHNRHNRNDRHDRDNRHDGHNRNRNRNIKNGMCSFTMKGRKIMQLKRIGKGGSGEVYQIITQDTLEILALKKIFVSNSLSPSQNGRDPMENYLNEIKLLENLRNKSYCIQMIDYEIINDRNYNRKEIRMLFEFGEIDLSHLLKSQPNGYFTQINFVKCYWFQILSAVDTVHNCKIVHGDLKPANFLLVKGTLKIIDFGIAKQIASNETTRIARDSQIGTLNYISPEALVSESNNYDKNGHNQYKLGRSADVWSLGCILHQMLFGRTPFTNLKFVSKLTAIVSESCHYLIKPHQDTFTNQIIKNCLLRDPKKRISINELINHPFLDSVRTDNLANDVLNRK